MRKIFLILSLFIFSCDEEVVDCAGVEDGSASIDNCGLCTGGTTGLEIDYLKDCTGVCGGSYLEDECGVCDGDGIADGECDCDGNIDDLCGVCGGDNTSCSFESQLLGSWLVVQDFEFTHPEPADNDKVYVYFEFFDTGIADGRIFGCNDSDCTIISNEGDLNDEDKSWVLWDKSGEYQYICFYDEQTMDGSETIAELVALGEEAPCFSYELSSPNKLILNAPFMGYLGPVIDQENYSLTLQKCSENDEDSHCYVGCTSESATDFDPSAQFDDGNCDWDINGTISDVNGNPIPGANIGLVYELIDFPENDYSGQPSVSIEYSLAQDSYVTLWIENVCGNTVKTLVDSEMVSGYYSIIWNSDDIDGEQVVNGAYYLRMRAGALEQTNTLIKGSSDYSSDNQNYHAISDENGLFNISLDCLSFGVEYNRTDEEGNSLGTTSIPWKAKFWIISDEHAPYSTEYYDIPNDTDIQVILP